MYYKNLSTEQVKRRQERFGNNSLPEEKPRSAWLIFFSQFVNPLVYVLLAVGLISLLMGKYNEIWFILVVVLLNALMGFFEENKTEKTLAALKNLVHPMARVMRDNVRRKINASELVPGDIVYLGAGEKVPADGELLEVSSLFINEAILTGESEAVKKEIGGEIFMGTIVVNGHAVMKVRTIGAATKIGSIAQDLGETKEPPTTLRVRLEKLTRTLIYISVGLSAVVFVFGVLAKRNPWEMLELAAVLLVAVIPEALLIVVTLVLVLAMRDSLKRKALIRRIFSVETLGSVTTICTDKTGTLTEGKMRVVELDLVNSLMAKKAMNLCNNLGDSVEVALWEHLEKKEKIKPQKISDDFRRTAEITFDSKHKFMAVAVSNEKIEKEHLILVKGAPEVVLKMTNLKEAERKQIIKQVDNWAEKGLKVLALASKKINKSKTEFTGKELVGLSWNGLVGLWDPPRKSVKRALKRAQRAGMKVKVVTGDYHRTAEKIMNFLDISPKKEEILTGEEMSKLSKEQFVDRVDKITLFARVTPNQKLKIVSALQSQKEIVAMTGDGVNDAPALKKADIGIVVGDATEVAKEIADLILLNNNFKTIISAVEAGRLVFENIKKIIFFILSNSFAEVTVILGALILGWPLPLTVVQILWLHLLCDGPEDFILGFEPKEKETMLDGPKRMDEPLLDRTGLSLIFIVSLFSGLSSLFFFWFFGLRQDNLILGQTIAFMSLAFSSVFYIFSCRTLRKPFWRYENFWSNPGLFAVVGFSLFLAAIISYLPLTQRLLGIVPLEPIHWLAIIAKGLLLILIIEIAKHFFGHRWNSGKKSV